MKIVRARSRTGVVKTLQSDGTYAIESQPARGHLKLFDAALQNRLTADWTGINRLSADAELQGKLPIIRSRSRDLEQNDPYAENFLKLRENNVVGHKGFTLQMKVRLSETIDPQTGEVVTKYDPLANLAIERGWKRWLQPENFLVTRDLHATEACKLIERTMQRDGDLLIRKVRGAPNEFGFALQLLESDYLDDQYIDFRGVPCNCPQERTLPDGRPFPYCQRGNHEIRMGVELHGDWKFPVACWLLANHPGDYFFGNNISPTRTRIPIEDIIHPFVRKRIEQTRGIPACVAAMLRLQMIGGMDEAALVLARAAAQKMGVITKEVPEDFQADEAYIDGSLGRTIEGAPGEFLEMPMGYDVKALDWNPPGENYGPFQKVQMRGAAAGMGVSYSSLGNDPSDANFSATRIGMLEERESYSGGQMFFINHILRPCFPDFLQAAMLRGIVDLPFARFHEFTDHEAVQFSGRSFPWIDPVKDIEAASKAIELGVTTRSEVAAENGKDFEEITATLGREKTMRDAAGLGEPKEEPAPGQPTKKRAEEGATKSLPAIKSAFVGDITLGELTQSLGPEIEETIRGFVPTANEKSVVARYGMTVPELLPKVDAHNYETAKKHCKRLTVGEAGDIVRGRAGKFILVLNDKIIDGHHHLARAEKGKVTSSLPVLDLSPLRHQTPAV